MGILNLFFILSGLEFLILGPVPDDSTPYALKVRAYNLNPIDTSYKFCIWVYDTVNSHYISQIWAQNKWKAGWTGYQPFEEDTGVERIAWVYMRIYKENAGSYIKFKYKNSDTAEVKLVYPQFQIINMGTEGGWLQGTVYKDSLLSILYENVVVIAKDSLGNPIGAYVSENNGVSEDGELSAGRFLLAVHKGKVYSLEFQESSGKLTSGWVSTISPYEIVAGETTYIDPLIIRNITFTPDEPFLDDTLLIQAEIYNPGETIQDVRVEFSYEDSEIESIMLDSIAGYGSSIISTVWRELEQGKHEIQVEVSCDDLSLRASRFVQIGEGEVVINEIMYKPDNSGEWVELLNRGKDGVNIKNWTIDNDTITASDYLLEPGGFIVLAESTGQTLCSIYGEIEVLSLGSKFPSLRDDMDSVCIRDAGHLTQSRVAYTSNWANNNLHGISLERINPNFIASDSTNWGSCVASSGATPGRTNSIYAESVSETATFLVSPQVFSPEKSSCNISYTLPFKKALVRLYIYDRRGRCVRMLADGSHSGAKNTYTWEGKDDKGKNLPIGIYIVYLSAKDELSDGSISKKTTVVLAKQLH